MKVINVTLTDFAFPAIIHGFEVLKGNENAKIFIHGTKFYIIFVNKRYG